MRLTLVLVLFVALLAGCGGPSGPVKPVESDRTPSDAIPQRGDEPVLEEEGP